MRVYIYIYLFIYFTISADTLIVAVAPKPPANHLLDDDEEEEEEELVQFSCSTSKRSAMLDIFLYFVKIYPSLFISVEVQNTTNDNLVEEENFYVSSRQVEITW
jgi:hypothetical protein